MATAPETGDGAPDLSSAELSGASVFTRFRAVLLALVALIIGGLAAVTHYETARGRERAVENAVRQTRNLALALQVDAQSAFRAADQAVMAVADALGKGHGAGMDDDAVVALMRSQLARGAVFRNLLVTDAAGRIRHSAREALPPVSIADRDYFRLHRERPDLGLHISPPLLSRIGSAWFAAVSRRLDGPDGAFAGIVFAVMDLQRFERFYASLDIGPNGSVTLWNRDGAALARHPQDERLDAARSPQGIRFPGIASGLEEQTLTGVSPVDGRERIVTIRAVDGLPLTVAVRLTADDYAAEWRASLRQSLLGMLAMAALVIVLMALLMRHLKRLEATTRALHDSERRSRAIFDSSFQHMGLMRPNGSVLALNRAACDFAGVTPDAVVGRPIWELPYWKGAADTVRRLRLAVEAAASGHFIRFETAVETRDGPRTLDVSIKPVRDEAGRVVLLVPESRDITERTRMEDSLRRSEARLRSYLDAAMEGFFVSDDEGRYVDVNRAACQTLGYSREEILAWRVSDVVPDGHPLTAASREAFRTVRRTGLFHGAMVLRHKERGAILAEINAVRLDHGRYLGVIRDVTERRRAEEALRASTSRLTALVRALPDLAFILDGDGVYREVVAAADERLLVRPAGELVGRGIRALMPGEPAERLLAALRGTVETGQPRIVEFPLSVPAGARWFEGRTQPLPPDFGPVPMVLMVLRDVTERVLAAERLAAAKELAESANRAKSAFLATMSHELRTPLNAIIGFSEIMAHEMFGPLGNARYGDYARHIQNSGTHLLDLINDVLDMSKLEAGRYTLEDKSIDVMDLLHACAALAAVPALQGGVTLDIVPARDLPGLRADDRALRQVVLNLLSNAVKFTPPTGRVTIAAALREDGGLAITVADTGIGIAPEALRSIAEPFHQADSSISRRFGGTGLGLSISRNLVELHGGTLSIDSAPGRGTTVTVLLPAARVLTEDRLAAPA